MTHVELQELLGAYALDAVDPDEAAAIEAHLPECPRCRAEVAELREMSALLAHSGADAPDGVWERISSSLNDVAPPLRLDMRRPRTIPRSWSVVLGAAAAIVIAVLAVSVVRLNNHVDDLEAANRSNSSSIDIAAAAEQALNAPGSRIARLTGDGTPGAVVVMRPDGQGFLLARSLPAPTRKLYEVWGANATGKVTALGTIPGPGVFAFTADSSIEVVMLTDESEPVSSPSGPAVVTGTLA
jgi:anti-sigma factor RsiW